MNVTIVSIEKKASTSLIEVTIRYKSALSPVKLIFSTLPNELALEFYEKASKETLDSMRGFNKSASRNKSDS
jgi:hypothetical protein